MVVYDIITPDNLKEAPTARPDWRQRAFRRIVPPTALFFWTGEQNGDSYEDDGITIDLAGQTLKQINEDTWLLQPSNIEIKIDFQTVKLKFPGVVITQAVLGDQGGEDASDAVIDELRQFFDNLLARQQTRKEVVMVNRLEFPATLHREPGNNKTRTLRRNLNHNAKGVIASFLTGKTGSINSQTNKLQQNIGIAMAPRPRKRQTRHRRRCRA